MIKHKIFKCFHRPFPFKILGFNRINTDMEIRSFTFTESCRYEFKNEDQLDWNKLFGWSFGLLGIHKNSVRFVWRYNLTTCKIDIGAYWYIDGYRNYYTLYSLEIGKTYRFKLTLLRDSVIFTVLYDYIPVSKYQLYLTDEVLDKQKYQCGIYFGGNRRAPHKIEIIEHLTNY